MGVYACFYRMVQVIVHVGCMSLKDSQELVSCCRDYVILVIFIECVIHQH